MRIIWQDGALDDLDRIRIYIADDNPTAASRIVARITTRLDILREHPLMGRSGRVPNTREFVFGNIPYIAVYRVDDERNTLEILHIVRTARRYPRED